MMQLFDVRCYQRLVILSLKIHRNIRSFIIHRLTHYTLIHLKPYLQSNRSINVLIITMIKS